MPRGFSPHARVAGQPCQPPQEEESHWWKSLVDARARAHRHPLNLQSQEPSGGLAPPTPDSEEEQPNLTPLLRLAQPIEAGLQEKRRAVARTPQPCPCVENQPLENWGAHTTLFEQIIRSFTAQRAQPVRLSLYVRKAASEKHGAARVR